MASRAPEVKLDSGSAGAKDGLMDRLAPAQCATMDEVRNGVDRLDEQIVSLLAERFRYMDAAARIKPSRAHVRDEARKSAVIANAGRIARREGLDEATVAQLYELLVEVSIAYEFRRFDALRDAGAASSRSQ